MTTARAMSERHLGHGAVVSAVAEGSIEPFIFAGIKNSCRPCSPCVNRRNQGAGTGPGTRNATGLRIMGINAIDCDVHPTVTGNEVLLPYLETYWRDSVVERGMGSLESASYPPL